MTETVKTTVEIPDALFRRAKVVAAERGQSLKTLFNEALTEKLDAASAGERPADPPWMSGFGKLAKLKKETARIQAEIDREFGAIEPEDRV